MMQHMFDQIHQIQAIAHAKADRAQAKNRKKSILAISYVL